ncbi:TIGR02206 family membrane protein [uncultured Winogradskyella sp.]|uniref:YwaF family protein n=1 Tax=uncultured Winogradskyella sp. TaxID=395353 RepID=UPI00261618B0|nr:TIGR02206 family membrane protein [uncultured Winogradskyella sp.]
MFFQLLLIISRSVSIGSLQHILPIVIAVGFIVCFINYSNRNFNDIEKQKAVHSLACFISFVIVAFHGYRMFFDNYNFKIDLPLYLCSLLALIIPVFTYYRKYWMFEILIFWIIGGTLQGVITPDIIIGFPSFDYFRYWIVHLGLLSVIFYFIFVFEMRPKLRSVFKSFIALQVYIALMMVLNYVLDANYFYLNEKPKSASLLDYFGEWPYYILAGQLIIIPLFMLIYLPFYLTNKKII